MDQQEPTSQRLTSWIGWIALAGFAASGLFAWSRVGESLVVTLAEGPDPQGGAGEREVALLQEDLRTLRADVTALAGSLGQAFAGLHDSLNAAAEQRERATRAEVAEAVARLDQRLDDAPAVRGDGSAAPVQPPPATGTETAEVPERAPGPAAPAPVGSTMAFLSFRLPSEGLAFGKRQRFEVIAALSRVGFDAESTLHDFSGVSADVSGAWTVCLARPDEGLAGSVSIGARSLDTGNADRDAEMRARLDAEARPQIEFQIERFAPGAGGVDAERQALAGTVHGRMTIRGRSAPFALPVRLHVDESKRLVVEGEGPLALSTFGVEAPSKLGVISMRDEVRIWIALRARCLGPVPETADAR